jgi:hypothetical protein
MTISPWSYLLIRLSFNAIILSDAWPPQHCEMYVNAPDAWRNANQKVYDIVTLVMATSLSVCNQISGPLNENLSAVHNLTLQFGKFHLICIGMCKFTVSQSGHGTRKPRKLAMLSKCELIIEETLWSDILNLNDRSLLVVPSQIPLRPEFSFKHVQGTCTYLYSLSLLRCCLSHPLVPLQFILVLKAEIECNWQFLHLKWCNMPEMKWLLHMRWWLRRSEASGDPTLHVACIQTRCLFGSLGNAWKRLPELLDHWLVHPTATQLTDIVLRQHAGCAYSVQLLACV